MNRILFIFSFLLLIACNNDTGKKGNGASAETTASPDLKVTDAPEKAAQTPRDLKQTSEIDETLLQSITFDMWEYEYAVVPSDQSKWETVYKGGWIDFEKDNTFKRGKWEMKTSEGTWTYDPAANVIKLGDANAFDETEEWEIKLVGDVMIWIGNTQNNHSGTQIKLARTRFPMRNPDKK